MKSLFLFLAAIVGISLSATARAAINLTPQMTTVNAGIVDYKFQLIDTQSHLIIGDADLAVDMEKKLHLLLYDPALREFRHVHPQFDGKTWNVRFEIRVNGNYWVWAQGETLRDRLNFSAPTRLIVAGGLPEWPAPPVLGDVRRGTSGNSVVELSDDVLVARQTSMLEVVFTHKDGTQPALTNYLGAFAHVVAVSNSGDVLQHVHPMNDGPNQGMIHAKFVSPGDYRIWIQFIDGGVLKVVPLSVTVKPKP